MCANTQITEQTCPTCGSRVEVATSDEGTSHYIPIVAPEPDEVEALSEPKGETVPWRVVEDRIEDYS